MKLALCNEVIREMPFSIQCEFAASLGYDALEIAPFTIANDPRDLTADDIKGVRHALADAGISCSSLHWLLVSPEGLSITTLDDESYKTTVDVMRRLVDLAAELGADVLVHGSPKQRQLDTERKEESRRRAVDAFRAAAEAAEKAGVIYCAEPLAQEETNFLNTVEEAVDLVNQIANPAFRTMVDCAASLRMNQDPAELLARFLPDGPIAHVQVNDGNRKGPGQGDYRLAPVFEVLVDKGYDGWVAVEPFDYVPDGPACAARAIGYLQGVMEGLK